MSATINDPRAPKLSSATRRTIVHGGLTFIALAYVTILVLAPLIGIIWQAIQPGWETIKAILTSPDAIHAFKLTAIITLITVAVTTFFGVIVALVLTRDHFPGKGLVSAFVDLPLAMSPVIVGVMAVLLFGREGLFTDFFTARGINILYALPSMTLVTIFICIPFVIREVAPVLNELGTGEEEAARTLGASSFQTFRRVTLKNIRWALLYGIALSTARSIGEIGAVAIVSGGITGQTETATLYILRQFDQFHDAEGFIVAMVLALVSIVLLIAIETFKRRQEKVRET